MKHVTVVLLCCLLTFGVEAQSPLAGALGARIRDKIREKMTRIFKEKCEIDQALCRPDQTVQPRKALNGGCDDYLDAVIPKPSPPVDINAECEPDTKGICFLCLDEEKTVKSAHKFEIEYECTDDCRRRPFGPTPDTCPDFKNAKCTKA